MPAADDSVLDNPAWNALIGPEAALATRIGNAARFDPEMSPFAGLADGDPASWADLARLVGPGGAIVLTGGPQSPPPAWGEAFRVVGSQMIADSIEPLLLADDGELVELGDADAPAMLDLATRTRPGPFESRTHEFGGYLGVYREGRLVAMAGERLRPPGFTEISAVCTDESARGEGLAGRLVRAVATNIERRGETPMLHVAGSNAGAIRLYEKLGFRSRTPITFGGFTAPGAA
ncbi:MAG TPA: GNAT family N-acetyltransferase [Pseudolysinimonas sp.]